MTSLLLCRWTASAHTHGRHLTACWQRLLVSIIILRRRAQAEKLVLASNKLELIRCPAVEAVHVTGLGTRVPVPAWILFSLAGRTDRSTNSFLVRVVSVLLHRRCCCACPPSSSTRGTATPTAKAFCFPGTIDDQGFPLIACLHRFASIWVCASFQASATGPGVELG